MGNLFITRFLPEGLKTPFSSLVRCGCANQAAELGEWYSDITGSWKRFQDL